MEKTDYLEKLTNVVIFMDMMVFSRAKTRFDLRRAQKSGGQASQIVKLVWEI